MAAVHNAGSCSTSPAVAISSISSCGHIQPPRYSCHLGMIRPASLQDGPAIAAIYNHYVTNTVVTFETEPVSEEEMTARVERVGASFPWLVYTRDQEVLGYAYANTLKDRRAYDRSAETTVYVRQDSGRQGVGGALYTALLDLLKQRGFHTAIGREGGVL